MAQMQPKTKLQVAIIPHSFKVGFVLAFSGSLPESRALYRCYHLCIHENHAVQNRPLACVPWMLYAQTENKKSAAPAPSIPDNKGRIVSGNTYKNPALDMTIALTGEWEFLDQETTRQAEGIEDSETTPRSGCQGPLCGTP